MKRCLYCGYENTDTAEFCEKCGNQLLDNVTDSGAGESFAVPPEEEAVPAQEAVGEEPAADPMQTQVISGQDEAGPVSAPEPADDGVYAANGYGYAAQASVQSEYDGQAYGYSQNDFLQEEPLDEPEEGFVPEDREGLRRKARKMIKNPLFFLAVCSFTASVLLGIVYTVTGGAVTNIATLSNTIKAQTGDVTALKYVDLLYNFLIGKDRILVSAAGVLLYMPSLMMTIALWMTFCQTTNKTEQINTSGFTFARVLKILEFIVVCAGILAGIGVSVYNVVTTAAAQQEVFMLFLGVIALLVVILFSVLVIMYYLQVIFSIRLVRTNCKTGADIGRFPGFVVFVLFLGALVEVASILPMAPDDYIGIAYGISRAAWSVLIFLWTVIYKGVVKNKQ